MVPELLDSLSMLTLPTDYHGGSYSAALSSEESVGDSAPPLQTIVQPPRTPLSITLLGTPLPTSLHLSLSPYLPPHDSHASKHSLSDDWHLGTTAYRCLC